MPDSAQGNSWSSRNGCSSRLRRQDETLAFSAVSTTQACGAGCRRTCRQRDQALANASATSSSAPAACSDIDRPQAVIPRGLVERRELRRICSHACLLRLAALRRLPDRAAFLQDCGQRYFGARIGTSTAVTAAAARHSACTLRTPRCWRYWPRRISRAPRPHSKL